MKKRMLAIITAVAMILAMTFVMTGCGGSDAPADLESYMAENPEMAEEVDKAIADEIDEDDGMSVKVSYEENCMIVDIAFDETFDAELVDAIGEEFEKEKDDFYDEEMDGYIKDIEEEIGVTGITVKYVIINGDGSTIWEQEFPEK